MPYKDPEKRREANRKASAKYYENNKQKVIKASAAVRRKTRAQWQEFKKTLSCIQCGENHPATLDFHHVIRSKENRKVHRLISNAHWKAVHEELKKCVVLCANCHRKHHHEEREHQKLVKLGKKKKLTMRKK